tara:strand:+ start:1987 stop:2694 length:708 start_codon:yes stop_codon:yes gene_type:complete
MDIPDQKNRLITLASEVEPEPEPEIYTDDELKIDPLADINLFSEKKRIIKKELVELKVEPIKIKQKRKPQTNEHKEKLRLSRLKGLETRRKNRELKRKQMEEQENNKQLEEKMTETETLNNDVYIENARKIIKNPEVRKKVDVRTYEKEDPDAEFKKFYSMMSKYENIKNKHLRLYKEQLKEKQLKEQKLKEQKLKEEQLRKKPILKKSYSFSNNKYRMLKQTTRDENEYLKYFQ